MQTISFINYVLNRYFFRIGKKFLSSLRLIEKGVCPLLAIAIFLIAGPTALATPAAPEKTVLPNGLSVITWLNPQAQLTTISVWVKAGSINENSNNSGISHFIEHLIFKGTPYKNAAEIATQAESLGGNFNGFTSSDFTCFHITLPHQFVAEGTELLLDMVRHPLFNRLDIENERKVVTEEIIRDDENPDYYLKKIIAQNFFGRHPYSRPIIGSAEVISKIPRGDIIDYFQKYYQPANTIVVVCGQFDPENLTSQIKKYFPENKPEKINVPRNQQSSPTKEKIIEAAKPVSQTYFSMGLPAPAVASRDSYVMDVILKILSGGRTGRLVAEIKEKQNLVSQIDAGYNTRRDPGILTIDGLIGNPQNIEAVITAVKNELTRLAQTPVSPEELTKAKDQTETEFFLNTETSFERTFILGYFEAIDGYLYGVNYLDEIEKVTPADIQKAARKYLTRPAVIGIIKPEVKEKPDLGDTA